MRPHEQEVNFDSLIRFPIDFDKLEVEQLLRDGETHFMGIAAVFRKLRVVVKGKSPRGKEQA